MKRWLSVLIALLVAGCAHSVAPEAPSPPPEPAPAPILHVTAIVVTSPQGERRYTNGSVATTLNLAGPLHLKVEVDQPAKDGRAEWFFQGQLGESPGRMSHRQDVLLGNRYEVDWDPGPGTNGRLWVSVWGDVTPTGRPGWRSWDIYPKIPVPPETQCPPVQLKRLDNYGEGSPGQSYADKSMNAFFISWLGDEYVIPLTADPTTCIDPMIATRLKEAQT
ncbi:MAG: hypothetical protein ACM3XM_06380, partial [Mycobacterium leprae]